MDQEERYRKGNPARERGEDRRPETEEELRARNARREKPVLEQRTRGPRPSRVPQGQTPPQKKTADAGKKSPARRRKPVRRQRKAPPEPETVVHWSDPKPFIRKVFVWKLIATFAVVIAIALGFSIFFKVGRITVSGTEKYTPEAVLAASGIEKGESLLSFRKSKKAGNILSALSYVKEVQIGIKLPDTVNINIVELEVTYAIKDAEGRWWLMDSNGKLVEGVSETEANAHTVISGLLIQNPQVGSMIEAMQEQLPAETVPNTTEGTEDTQPVETTAPPETAPAVTAPGAMTGSGVSKVEAVVEILHALESNNLMGEIKSVDLTYLYNITLWYEDRFEVRFGEPVDLTYKVNYMAQAISQFADYEMGVLDVTFENEKEVRFIPNQGES